MQSETTRAETQLDRGIGPWLLLLLVVGNILGAGIYAIIGEVAAETGGMIWAAFLAAAILAGFTCLAYLELITKFPQAGGAALYASRAFHRPWLTLTVGFAVAASAITSAATSARAFSGEYLGAFVDLPAVPIAVGFILALSFLNFIGISESLKANVALTAIVVAGLLLVVGVGVAALLGGDADLGRLSQPPADTAVPLAVLGGTALAFFAFVGFEDSAQVAEETVEPSRSYPRGLLGGLAVTTIVYLLVAAATASVIDPAELAGSTGPLIEVVEVGSSIPGQVIGGIALVALTNTALLQLIAASRLLYGIARRGGLPRAFGRVHSGRKTPWVAILAIGVGAAILTATGGLGELADTTVLLLLTVFVVVNVSALALRREDVERRHFEAPAALLFVGAAVSAGLVVYTAATSDAGVLVRYVALLSAGLLLFGVQRAIAPKVDQLDVDDLSS